MFYYIKINIWNEPTSDIVVVYCTAINYTAQSEI